MYNIVKTISYEVLVLGIIMMNSKIHQHYLQSTKQSTNIIPGLLQNKGNYTQQRNTTCNNLISIINNAKAKYKICEVKLLNGETVKKPIGTIISSSVQSSWLGGVISGPDYNLIIDNPTSRSELVIVTATYEQEVLSVIVHSEIKQNSLRGRMRCLYTMLVQKYMKQFQF